MFKTNVLSQLQMHIVLLQVSMAIEVETDHIYEGTIYANSPLARLTGYTICIVYICIAKYFTLVYLISNFIELLDY